ncbi:N-formylglutamate amidohydrolase [Pelagovum pacificum]|uniref:N-formylglutamate amidohydrolase n=1 Tax=Pelagovum pacificum TaxID=2588711 RepID=A0A5C5GG36_9RHOB|nr:N-formylglutamate amidohydrolase [Pelagovum pacificum]QQA43153.1 N-formylglutamate amidohydrolase [Pelagovum pacificum]TNY33705.1 N-formylglutamate amidohydrolase [Pelagovum pacificum]
MSQAPYQLFSPDVRTTSVSFASPHSGRDYPASFLASTILDQDQVRSSEDAFVDRLFDCAPRHGAPLLVAGAPRAFVDLNRAAEELDPALIDGVRRASHNPRTASGLGVIPRVVANGRAIYRGKIPISEAHRRLAEYWTPYHGALQAMLEQSHAAFGEAILIDCHSMPHEALEHVGPAGSPRPDVVIGDRFGASASTAVVERVAAAFTNAGFRVARNMPFAGAYITQHYGRPSRRQHAVQVEIDRSLYMDEAKIEPTADFEAVRHALDLVVETIADFGRARDLPVAAE